MHHKYQLLYENIHGYYMIILCQQQPLFWIGGDLVHVSFQYILGSIGLENKST